MIRAHGGRLVDRTASDEERDRLLEEADGFPSLQLNPREINDFEMLAVGALSPLRGFMGRSDFESVCRRGRLANDTPWTIPITLSASFEEADRLEFDAPGGKKQMHPDNQHTLKPVYIGEIRADGQFDIVHVYNDGKLVSPEAYSPLIWGETIPEPTGGPGWKEKKKAWNEKWAALEEKIKGTQE